MEEEREVHGEGRIRRNQVQGRGALGEKMFRGLRAADVGFCLCLWLVRRGGKRRYAPTSITVLTALTIWLFKVKDNSIAFLRVPQRAF